jgi:hypothetical protein
MRTTVNVDDNLLAAAKVEAHRRGRTLGELFEDALRRELAERAAARGPALPVFHGGSGPAPGVDLRSNRDLSGILDAGRDGS